MDYIVIEGYKSLRAVKIDLQPINILIGANGSGKSNFISFFDFLHQIYRRNINDYIALSGGADKVLYSGQKITDRIAFKMEFDKGQNGYAATLVSGNAGFIFTDERLIYKSDNGVDISASKKEANIKMTNNERAKYVSKYFTGFRKYHFHDTSKNSPFTRFSHIKNDKSFLYSDGGNIASFLYSIYNNHKIVYRKIIKTIQSIAPYFLDFYFAVNEENLIRLQWMDRHSDVTYGVTDLSDGTLRFIALVVLFMQPNLPNTIIIDEPELGLHPAAIAKLVGMIKSVAQKNCQVIIATQSTDLISYFHPHDIVTVDRIKGESVFERLSETELALWLEDYTIDDLWKRNIIAKGQPYLKKVQ